jgi:hypothetical protein
MNSRERELVEEWQEEILKLCPQAVIGKTIRTPDGLFSWKPLSQRLRITCGFKKVWPSAGLTCSPVKEYGWESLSIP